MRLVKEERKRFIAVRGDRQIHSGVAAYRARCIRNAVSGRVTQERLSSLPLPATSHVLQNCADQMRFFSEVSELPISEGGKDADYHKFPSVVKAETQTPTEAAAVTPPAMQEESQGYNMGQETEAIPLKTPGHGVASGYVLSGLFNAMEVLSKENYFENAYKCLGVKNDNEFLQMMSELLREASMDDCKMFLDNLVEMLACTGSGHSTVNKVLQNDPSMIKKLDRQCRLFPAQLLIHSFLTSSRIEEPLNFSFTYWVEASGLKKHVFDLVKVRQMDFILGRSHFNVLHIFSKAINAEELTDVVNAFEQSYLDLFAEESPPVFSGLLNMYISLLLNLAGSNTNERLKLLKLFNKHTLTGDWNKNIMNKFREQLSKSLEEQNKEELSNVEKQIVKEGNDILKKLSSRFNLHTEFDFELDDAVKALESCYPELQAELKAKIEPKLDRLLSDLKAKQSVEYLIRQDRKMNPVLSMMLLEKFERDSEKYLNSSFVAISVLYQLACKFSKDKNKEAMERLGKVVMKNIEILILHKPGKASMIVCRNELEDAPKDELCQKLLELMDTVLSDHEKLGYKAAFFEEFFCEGELLPLRIYQQFTKKILLNYDSLVRDNFQNNRTRFLIKKSLAIERFNEMDIDKNDILELFIEKPELMTLILRNTDARGFYTLRHMMYAHFNSEDVEKKALFFKSLAKTVSLLCQSTASNLEENVVFDRFIILLKDVSRSCPAAVLDEALVSLDESGLLDIEHSELRDVIWSLVKHCSNVKRELLQETHLWLVSAKSTS